MELAVTEHVADTRASAAGPDGRPWQLRMKDLQERTGLSRQVIHFYIREGLLPPGHKATKNSAFYGEAHIERLLWIRRLQTERFLPLRAIRAVVHDEEGPFTREQRAWIRELKAASTSTLARGADGVSKVAATPIIERLGLSHQDLDEMSAIGVVPVVEDADGTAWIAAEDAWALECLGALRREGFTEARGFHVRDLALYEETIAQLFEREATLLATRIARFSVAEAAPMLERLLPIIHTFLTRYHETRIRRFFSTLG